MTDRILRVMLITALLASQAAVCSAHSHYGSEPADHAANSHIHLFGHSHHDDPYGHDAHHQHGPIDHEHSDEHQPADTESDYCSGPSGDHDGNAVFFGDQDDFPNQSSRLAANDLTSFAVWFVSEELFVSKTANRCPRNRAQPLLIYGCAIYLATSRLLI